MKATPEKPYPHDFEEFIDWFHDEPSCMEYLEWVRWPGGFVCPRCAGKTAWKTSRGLWHCQDCGRQTSPTSGTVFADGRKPLRLWFHVMWLMMAQKTGISAKNFQDTFGFGSYQTTWGWLHKLRSVMVVPGRGLLSGEVEVDETYVGGQKHGARGRGAEGKTPVLVAVEIREGKLGRCRFRACEDVKADTVMAFLADCVASGALLRTDGLNSYLGAQEAGFDHRPTVVSKAPADDDAMSHVHLVVSLLKRWLAGTHQGATTPNHLQEYLDEFAFRFNRRLSTHRGKLFHRLMQQAVTARPKGIKQLYVPKH
ncbi:MAG: IS1595 family transposase [Kiritimatiellae bacterium]|jgi:transposase-like protein|nr:IS1595 family transposase [Kiritimatiellia bacterium]